MRTERRARRLLWSVTAMLTLTLVAAGPLWCDDDLARHIMDEAKAPWQRLSPVQIFSPDGLTEVDARLAAAADGYEIVTGATARFGLPDDGQVQVTLLEMNSALDALGVFAADRPESPQRVALASPAYWHEGALRLFAGRWYLHLRADRNDEIGLALTQQLALQLEMRFPPTQRRPRIMNVMPHRYLNPYLLDWGLVDICGDGCARNTLVGTCRIGDQPLTISVVECADAQAAREIWTQLLNAALRRGRTIELPDVAAEGFTGGASGGRICAAIWQDEFVVIATGDTSREDAEALLRIVSVHIRTTRPLPHITSGE